MVPWWSVLLANGPLIVPAEVPVMVSSCSSGSPCIWTSVYVDNKYLAGEARERQTASIPAELPGRGMGGNVPSHIHGEMDSRVGVDRLPIRTQPFSVKCNPQPTACSWGGGLMECLLWVQYIYGFVQGRRNVFANALELRLSCTNPSIWSKSSLCNCCVFSNVMLLLTMLLRDLTWLYMSFNSQDNF